MNAIEVKNLKKYFGKVKAIDGISFTVAKGEIFGFLGPNGAGKTTTIRCLMDYIRPTSGGVVILGKDSKKDTVEIKSKVGYIPGNIKLNNNWTGFDHLKFVESIRGKSETAEALAQKFELDLSKKFRNLSSGNKQKLGLVLALMSDPEVIIMDEPTVGLDPLLQNTIYEILLDLKAKGKTIFVSSHNLPEVERLCDRVGIIKQGKMVAVETLKGLEGKKLHKVEIRFSGKFNKSDFDFDGVEKIEDIADGVILTVGGNLNPIIRKLAKYDIADMEISHATLEEVFLKFYEKKS